MDTIFLDNLKLYLRDLLADRLGLEDNEIDEDTAFFTLGVTSLISTEILNGLGEYYDQLSSTLLFEYPNILSLAGYLAQNPLRPEGEAAFQQMLQGQTGNQDETQATKSSSPEEQDIAEGSDLSDAIAVIGLSGKFPEADTVFEFYKNLLAGRDSVTEIPKNRWSHTDLYSKTGEAKDSITSKWGGFINDIELFDAKFFKILPAEAEIMDPQQKLFLECAWQAMEDGGYGKISKLPTNNVGVYAGVTWNEFSNYANEQGGLQGGYRGPGSLYWGIPNRTSYYFNFNGPSIAIDSACSSSLAALHLACQGIISGDCEMALAGGVNLNLHPAKYQFLSRNHFLASDGKCRSFGQGGDGYVPGEGVGIVLLKPLAKAISDKDQIYGVIRGTSVNHGGKVTGYTVPNPMAHRDLILKTMERAKIKAQRISYVECHGTGTELGDPIEITGLKTAFETSCSDKQFCAIGSVKSNIGHLEAVAGITGLIKVLLSMKEGILPASLHCQEENSKINFKDSPFYLLKENKTWQATGQETLVAGVSSFGAGGSNAHCLVESFDPRKQQQNEANKAKQQLLLFSAKTAKSLRLQLAQNHAFLHHQNAQDQKVNLADMAFSLARREVFGHRVAIIAENRDEARSKIQRLLDNKTAPGVYWAELAKAPKGGSEQILIPSEQNQETLTEWARQWATGEINHLRLESEANLISLPPYAFDRKRSWISPSSMLYVNPFQNFTSAKVHPLLDSNQSTVAKGRFVKRLHLSEFILEDHLVADLHVVPGVCHLEMARAAAAAYLQQDITSIKNVWFSKRIALEDVEELNVCCEIEEDQGEYHYVIKETAESGAAIFSRGSVGLQPLNPKDSLDIDAIKARCPTSMEIAEFYATFRRIGIIQRHSFNVVETFQAGDQEAIARISLPRSLRDNFKDFHLHPALMDGAVQTAMIQLLHILGREISIVPFSFEQVVVHDRLPENLYVYSRLENRNTKTFSVQIVDEQGRVLIEFVNFILKEFSYGESTEQGLFLQIPALKQAPVDSSQLEKVQHLSLLTDLPQLKEEFITKGEVSIHSLSSEEPSSLKQELQKIVSRESSCEDILLYQQFSPDLDQALTSKAFIDTKLQSLFFIAKTCAKADKPINLLFCCPEQQGITRAMMTATASFFKALKRENSHLNFRFVCHSPLLPLGMVGQRMLAELRVTDTFQEVYLDKEANRFVRTYQAMPQSPELTTTSPFKDGGQYLLSGGLGGVGQIIAKHILDHSTAELLLLGRSSCSPAQLEKLFAAKAHTGRVRYLQADITTEQGFDTLQTLVDTDFTGLNGVFHCAGIIQDDYLLKKDWSTFQEVLAPKIAGSENLDKATSNLDLDFFVLFSSITSVFGNLAQSDYAYANGFMDHFAYHRNRLVAAGERAGHSLAINWPFWQQGGMPLSQRQLELYHSTYKIQPLSNETALLALEQAIRSGEEQVVVVNGLLEEIHRHLNFDNEQQLISTTTNDDPEVNLGNSEEVRAQIRTFIAHLFMESLELEEEDLDHSENFTEMGIDSITVIDIIQVLEKSKRFANLPNTIFLENDSIDKVVSYFEKTYPGVDYEPLPL